MADRVTEEESVAHQLVQRAIGEEVEGTTFDRPPAAEGLAVHRSCGLRAPPAVRPEPVEILDLDEEVHGQSGPACAPAAGPDRVVVFAEGDMAGHRLAEAQPYGTAGPAAHRTTRDCVVVSKDSANRSASAAMVRLGLTPTGPGMTDPSAT